MKAIILAAGKGLRIDGLTKNRPKCMLEVGGESAIERQIRLLRQEGIKEIIIVTGYKAGQIKKVVNNEVRLIHNPDYNSTSSTFSLWKARKEINGNVLVLNSDIAYTRDFLKMMKVQFAICLPVNTQKPYEKIDVGIQIKNGKVVRVGKNMPRKFCQAESVDAFFVGKRGCARVKKTIEKMVKADPQKGGIYSLKNELVRQKPLFYKDVGYSCVDFDTPEEYQRAKELFD